MTTTGSAVGAEANVARNALAEAKAAMAAQPPNPEAARAALILATTSKDDAVATADAYLGLGRMDRDERKYARALTNYRACVTAAPSTLWARRAAQQIAWLSARSEGDFAPLERFERVELDPTFMGDPAAIDALARDADAFPPGLVRVEARRFIAEAWLADPHRHSDAITELQKVKGDLKYAEPWTDRTIERELVDTLIAAQDFHRAAREVISNGNLLDPPFVVYVRRLIRRRAIRHAALSELLVFGVVALFAVIRNRRTIRQRIDRHTPRLARIAAGLGIGVSVLSAIFLLLEILKPTYLERLGL